MEDDNDGLCMNRYLGSDDEDSDGVIEETSNDTLEAENSVHISGQKAFQSRTQNGSVDSNHMNDETSITKINDNNVSRKWKKRKAKKNNINNIKLEPIEENFCQISTTSNDNNVPPKRKKRKVSQPDEEENFSLVNAKKNNINNIKLEPIEENFCQIGEIKNTHIKKIKPILPKWLSNPKIIEISLKGEEASVTEIPYLDETSKQNLKQAGINFLFPVQSAVIPWLLEHEKLSLLIKPPDLCVSAPTGSGKTLAFVLPIVQSLKGSLVTAVRAVIVLPVVELAIQVYKVVRMFVRGTFVKVALIMGQKSFIEEQQILVKKGVAKYRSRVDIIVTTPGRILDHIGRTEGFSLKDLRYLVIDEADRMMSDIEKGWLKQIEDAVYGEDNPSNSKCTCFSGVAYKRIRAPAASVCEARRLQEPLQKLLFSATLCHDPEKLHMLSLYRPVLFAQQNESDNGIGKCPIPYSLRLYSVICSFATKPIALCHFLKQRQFKKVLCFTDTVERAERLKLVLEELGIFRVKELSSSAYYTPVQRKIILSQFTSGKVDILICSDLVARGMDFENVDCVISYDVPNRVTTFIHRMGRTARAGREGAAVTLLSNRELNFFEKMLVSAGISKPERITIHDDDLESYVASFRNALTVADSKLRDIKKAMSEKKTMWGKKAMTRNG